jgi:ribosomal RNA-processing protein 9
MTYVETLYGHQSAVSDMDCHSKERPISVGRDRTARAWKLAEDAHLIFRPGSHVPAADSVVVPREEWFVTGHENSQLSLWRTDKKRPVATIDWAHGQDGGIGRSITALGCLKGSDLVTSGSYDGYLRFWHVSMGLSVDERGIESAGAIPVYGYINGVAIGPKARFCVVAIGQEPSLGRWNCVAKAKNRLGIIRLRHNVADEEDDGPEDAQNIRKDAKGDKNEVNSDSESSVS